MAGFIKDNNGDYHQFTNSLNVEINNEDTPVGVANFIKVNGLNYEIGGFGEASKKVLWTNPNPTSNFNAQTITTEDMSGYEYLLINFNGTTSSTYGFSQLFKRELVGGRLFYGDSKGLNVIVRPFNIISNTSISFDSAKYKENVLNDEIIPTEIIGIKLISIKRYATETWQSSDKSTWYTIYNDGWKECGGFFEPSGTATIKTITLPITFSDTNYYPLVQIASAANNKNVAQTKIINNTKTVNSFGVVGLYTSSSSDGYGGFNSVYYCFGY